MREHKIIQVKRFNDNFCTGFVKKHEMLSVLDGDEYEYCLGEDDEGNDEYCTEFSMLCKDSGGDKFWLAEDHTIYNNILELELDEESNLFRR